MNPAPASPTSTSSNPDNGLNLSAASGADESGIVETFLIEDWDLSAVAAPTPKPDPVQVEAEWKASVRARYAGAQIRDLAPGVVHVRLAGINVVEANLDVNPRLFVQPVMAGAESDSRATVSNIVRNYRAVVGVNGSFFGARDGRTIGLLMSNGQIISGPIPEHDALAITKYGFSIDRFSMVSKFTNSTRGVAFDVVNLNQPDWGRGVSIAYTRAWGDATPIPKPAGDFSHVVIQNGKIAQISNNPVPIPPLESGGVAMIIPKDKMGGFAVGDAVSLTQELVAANSDASEVQFAIGGGPALLRNGNVQDLGSASAEITGRHRRTAFGFIGRTVMLVTFDKEVNLRELAEFMRQIGAEHAINLDGGGSTSMASGNDGLLSNAGQVRPVSNGLILYESSVP